MSDNIIVTNQYLWKNEHNNLNKQVLRRFQVFNNSDTGWREGLKGVQEIIGKAYNGKERLRSYGGKWSLSDVAICNDSIHDSKPLTFYGTVGQSSILGKAIFKKDSRPLDERIFYFQSGAQINQINNVLEKKKLSLATTGASNGQTIAGAISTGTHGSALKIGSMQDYVRALHIVTSENEHFILQPKTQTIVNKKFSDVFGAKLISNDKLFYSALVSFGSFGIIIGVILETVSLYILETHTIKTDYSIAESIYESLGKFNHNSSTNLKKYLNKFGLPDKKDPHHIDLIVNPYSEKKNTFLRVMYSSPYDKTKCSRRPGRFRTRVGDDILSIIGSVTTAEPDLAESIINILFGQAAKVQSGYTQTPKYIFGDSTIYKPKQGGASTELGVHLENAAEVMKIVIDLAKKDNFVGLIGVRFVKNSNATLAFTRFSPLTCTIELPGLNTPSTQQIYINVFTSLDNRKIPLTLHWGQEGDYSPKRLSSMYGKGITEWIRQRNRFLPDPLQRYMFTNDFLKRCGLGESPPLVGGDIIA